MRYSMYASNPNRKTLYTEQTAESMIKYQPAGGAIGKVRRLADSLRFILREPLVILPNFMAIHLMLEAASMAQK